MYMPATMHNVYYSMC